MKNIFVKLLLEWFETNKRDLPWKETSDPYKIWISEVILQQTRVKQGYDYYLRFIACFPTVKELAQASEDEVMKLWQGLGYYSRARNLHAAAKQIIEKGDFPSTYEEVLALKGVGEYTAAAICSFAYNLPYAVVDGNVYRVLSRFFGVENPIDTTAGRRYFQALAQELLPLDNPANYNQAIMDFGAIQCVPKGPACMNCIFHEKCFAYGKGQVGELPVKKNRVKVRERYFNYLYIHSDEQIYFTKRGEGDIWQNLYDFPLIETERPIELDELLKDDKFKDIAMGIKFEEVKKIGSTQIHILSHQRLHINFYEIYIQGKLTGNQQVSKKELSNYAVPKPIEKFLKNNL